MPETGTWEDRDRTARRTRADVRVVRGVVVLAVGLASVTLTASAGAGAVPTDPRSRPGAVLLHVPGAVESQAEHVNDDGVVVGTFVDATGTRRAFRWRAGIGEVLADGGVAPASVTGVNRHGQVAGNLCAHQSSEGCHAVLWERDGSLVELAPGHGAATYDLNDHGVVVGVDGGDTGDSPVGVLWQDGASTVVAPFPGVAMFVTHRGTVAGRSAALGSGSTTQAFLWRDGVVTVLAAPDDDTFTVPWAMNERDDVVGHIAPDRFVVWQADGQVRDLDQLGASTFTPAAIDDHGVVVGSLEQGGTRAFVADGRGTRLLPTLGGARSAAVAVDASGTVVGWAQRRHDPPATRHAVVWTGSSPTALGECVPGRRVVGSEATDVNRRGQVVGFVESTGPRDSEPRRQAVLWDVRGRS